MPFRSLTPDQLEWTTRPHEPGEPARHTAELSERIGFAQTATLYCGVGMLLTLLIALHWRTALWPLHAAANAR